MIRKNIKCLLSLALVCLVLLSGCQKQETVTPIEVTPTDVFGIAVNQPEVTNVPTVGTSVKELDTIKELSIYSIDAETSQKTSVIAMVASDMEITPQMIVDKVVESMADETFMIGIDSVTTEDDKVIVSFLDDQPPVTNVGSSVEGEILDAIAMSLVENLPEYHKVIFRVMGESYMSGHMEFDKDYVYLESNE